MWRLTTDINGANIHPDIFKEAGMNSSGVIWVLFLMAILTLIIILSFKFPNRKKAYSIPKFIPCTKCDDIKIDTGHAIQIKNTDGEVIGCHCPFCNEKIFFKR